MDNNILDRIDSKELGRELQGARVRSGFTQEDAAKLIDVARTTITAIEKGERRIRVGELIKLAHAYGCEINDLVRPRPEIEMSKPQFRGPVLRSDEDNKKVEPSVELLKQLSRNYYELEQITDTPLFRKYPLEYDIDGLRTTDAAENVALEERNRLGLGDGPISAVLRDILEQDVGLRIFYIPINPTKFSAIYLYDNLVGGCIAVNSLHPEERRRWSLAHDYGHFLVHRHRPGVFIEDGYRRKPESERFADDFALYFLMPTNGLTRRFNNIRRTKNKVTSADLCILANYYGVSVEAMTLRLEDLKLLPTGMWDRLKEMGFKVREAQQKLGLEPIPSREDKFPVRYQYLALDALDRGLITEGTFANFLQCDRIESRRIGDTLRQSIGIEMSESTSDIGSDVKSGTLEDVADE